MMEKASDGRKEKVCSVHSNKFPGFVISFILTWAQQKYCFNFASWSTVALLHRSPRTHNPLLAAVHGAEDLQQRRRLRHFINLIKYDETLTQRFTFKDLLMTPPNDLSFFRFAVKNIWLCCRGQTSSRPAGRGGGETRIKRLMRPH